MTILLVEDDADCATVLQEALEMDGHEVLAAASAREVRQVLARMIPDVVVMDVRIGQDDGIALTRELRGGPLAGVPVILTTGRSHAEVAQSAREAGIARVLVKPVDLGDLLEVVARVVKAARASARTAS